MAVISLHDTEQAGLIPANRFLGVNMDFCPYCSDDYSKISHGGKCPKVKLIKYYENGTIKEVEFFDERQPLPPIQHFGIETPQVYPRLENYARIRN